MALAPRFFRWHRWLGYLVAIQVVLWVAGGALFAWLPFQAWVKAADSVAKPVQPLPQGWAQALAAQQATLGDAAVLELRQAATASGPAWRVKLADGERWWSAAGGALPPPGAADVERFARSVYRGPGALVSVVRVHEVPRRWLIVQEARGGRPLWLARFDDALATRLYIDATSGELVAVRNEAWVVYDFFFRLHVMDYLGGDDFNHPLIRAASVAALALVATGGVLSVLALRRAWRRHAA
jgi:hypothetical protein